VSSSGQRNRNFPDHNYYLIYEIPSGYTVTSGVVGDVGVWFDTYEYSDFCGINLPVPNIDCQITDGSDIYSCQTSGTGSGSIQINFTDVRVSAYEKIHKTEEWAGWNGSEWLSGGWTEKIYSVWNMTGAIRDRWFWVTQWTEGIEEENYNIPHGNETNFKEWAGWAAYTSPINVLDIDYIEVYYNASSTGIACNDGFFRSEWYVGFNTTHYLNRTTFCPTENFTVHNSYMDNNTLGLPAPIHFNTTSGNNYIYVRVFASTIIADVDYPVGNLFFIPPQMNITYYTQGRAVCTVGNIVSGEYDWSCSLNSSYESLEGNPYVSGTEVIIFGENTTIFVPMVKLKTLTLNISLIDEDFTPVINAKCSNSMGSRYSQLCKLPNNHYYGCCEFVGVARDSEYLTTITPNRANMTVSEVTFLTSDYYNTEGLGVYTTQCAQFDGNYQYVWNIDTMKSFDLTFHVYDCNSDKAISGARVTYEAKTCFTGSDGFCEFKGEIFDYKAHNYTMSKRPYYEDREITNIFHYQEPLSACMYRNASRNDADPEGAGAIVPLGEQDYSGIISAMADPTFVAMFICILTGAVITYGSKSGLMGLSSTIGLAGIFTMWGFFPIWVGIVFIMITGFFAVMTLRGVFSGG